MRAAVAPAATAAATAAGSIPVATASAATAQPSGSAAAAGDQDGKPDPALLPTPTYNAGVLSDAAAVAHAAVLQRAAAVAPRAMTDGLLLLKVWAAQQGLSPSSPTPCADGLDGHLAAMVMAHLANSGKLSASMSALQALRAALHALCDPMAGLPKGVTMSHMGGESLASAAKAAAPLLTSPPFDSLLGWSQGAADNRRVGANSGEMNAPHGKAAASEVAAIISAVSGFPPAEASPGAAAFKKAGAAAVWVDPTGWCNLAAHMTKSSVASLVAAARASLTLLESPRDPDESFTAAFLTPSSPATLFDYLWSVSVKPWTLPSPAAQQAQPPSKKQKQKRAAAAPETAAVSVWR